ncbi:MAG TPA: FkbM family methyltransferase [Bryobacteraceae bacterium]|nr:FkbM family methyltransferase [Bryobacteraceae bacterium]
MNDNFVDGAGSRFRAHQLTELQGTLNDLQQIDFDGEGSYRGVVPVIRKILDVLSASLEENRQLRGELGDLRRQIANESALLVKAAAQQAQQLTRIFGHDSILSSQEATLIDLTSRILETESFEQEVRTQLQADGQSLAQLLDTNRAHDLEAEQLRSFHTELEEQIAATVERTKQCERRQQELQASVEHMRSSQTELHAQVAERLRGFQIALDQHKVWADEIRADLGWESDRAAQLEVNIAGRRQQLSSLPAPLDQAAAGILPGLQGPGTAPNGFRHLLGRVGQELEALRNSVGSLVASVSAARHPPVYMGRGTILTRTNRGLDLICRSDDVQITPRLLRQGAWEPALVSLMEQWLKPGMKYLDIGANVGYFTTIAGTLVGHFGRIHAFEPHPEIYRLLQLNAELHRQSYICTFENLALADTPGERTFNTFRANIGSSTLSSLPPRLLGEMHEEPVPVTVPCTTLNEYYAGRNEVFDFIKIDAEGAECMIFEGGANFFRRNVHSGTVVSVECTPPARQGLGRSPSELIDRVGQAGYSVWQITSQGALSAVTRVGDLDTYAISDLVLFTGVQPPVQQLSVG